MRLGLVVTSGGLSGAPVHLRTLAEAMGPEGCVAVFGTSGEVSEALRRKGFTVHILGGLRSVVSVPKVLSASRRLSAILTAERVDLVHSHSSVAGLCARLSCLASDVPVIHTWHGVPFTAGTKLLTRTASRWTEQLIWSFCPRDGEIFICDADRDLVSSKRGRLGRHAVIYNGVESRPQPFPAGPVTAVMVARVGYQKDHETLLAAFRRSRLPRLVLVGPGTDDRDFVAMGRRWAGERAADVSFAGPRLDPSSVIAEAHFGVLSSRYEGFPLALLECLGLGRPIVASAVGGVPEILERSGHGELVPPGDVDAMRAALDRTAERFHGSTPEARSLLPVEFREETMLARTVAFYDEVLRARVGG